MENKDKPAYPEWIAQFKTSQQVSPDDWELISPSLKVTESTTIKEIRDWMDRTHGGRYMKEFKVIEIDLPKTESPTIGE